MDTTTKLPWIEKYRPSRLSNVISHENVLSTLSKYVIQKTFPNMIVYGSPGIGKTSIVKACASELFGSLTDEMTLEINASEDRGIETVRTRITQFANSTNAFSINESNITIKLVILDEADSMTDDAQIALKNTIDEYPSTKFCLICNCIKKIHYPIVSRCIGFRLHPIPKQKMFEHAKFICKSENVNISDEAINEIIKFSFGDMRKIINVLQSTKTAYDECNIDINCVIKYLNQIPYNTIDIILNLLLNKTVSIHDAYEEINKIISENGYSFYELVRKLNEKLLEHKTPIHTHIIKKIGTIEYQIFSNVNIQILILSLISVCKNI